jgi:hypothetical protein
VFNFLSSLFGGSQNQQQQQSVKSEMSGGQSTSSDVTTPGNYNPFTAALMPNITGAISSLGGGSFGAFPTPSGPFAAPMSAGETSVLSALPTGYGSSPAAAGYTSDLLSGKYLPGASGSNPFLNAAITAAQRPTLTGLNQVLGQDLPSQFIQSGQVFNPRAAAGAGGPGAMTDTGSTAFDTAAGRAVNTAAQTISDIASKMSESVYNTERQLQNSGVQLSQGELQSTVQNLQAQSLPRMIQQYGIDQGTKVFQSTVQNVLAFLQTMGGIGGAQIASARRASSQSTPHDRPRTRRRSCGHPGSGPDGRTQQLASRREWLPRNPETGCETGR